MIRVGICGAGQIVPNHCAAIARTDGVELAAISSRTRQSAKKMARKYKVKNAYDDHRRLIESPEIEAVIVCAPNYQHYELTMRALDAGKHVMVEKPLAMNVAQGEKMVAAAKKAGLHLLYAENLPLAPKFARLIAMAQDGDFGEIYMVRQVERHAGPYSPWFFEKKTAGGGALMDLGCHSISVVREILNKEKVKKVSAVSRTYRHTQGDVEDFIIVQMAYVGGAVGVVESNWCHLGGMDSVTEVFGDKGNGYADLFYGSGLKMYAEKEDRGRHARLRGWRTAQYDPVYENGYLAQIEGMAQTLAHDAPPLQSGDDGLAVLKIMMAAYCSAKHWGEKVTG
ncbi:MAG: Gfo/Idh/MocA family protein [Alphaproteobacteria bacterium]